MRCVTVPLNLAYMIDGGDDDIDDDDDDIFCKFNDIRCSGFLVILLTKLETPTIKNNTLPGLGNKPIIKRLTLL